MVKVSVLTPVYATEENGRLEMLIKCLDSVKNQGFSDYEHLILDDGSTLDIGAVIDARKDKHIRVIKTGHIYHQMPAVSWKHMLTMSLGEYKIVLGSDDRLTPGSLDKLSFYLDTHDDMVAVSGAVLWFNYDGTTTLQEAVDVKKESPDLLANNIVHCCATMFRKETLEEHWSMNILSGFCTDWDLWLQLNEAGPFGAIPDTVLEYVRHQETFERQTIKDTKYRMGCIIETQTQARERRKRDECKPLPVEVDGVIESILYVTDDRTVVPDIKTTLHPLSEKNFKDIHTIIYHSTEFNENDPFIILCGKSGKLVISNHQFPHMKQCRLTSPEELETTLFIHADTHQKSMLRKRYYVDKKCKTKLSDYIKKYNKNIFKTVKMAAVIPVHGREELLKHTLQLLGRQTVPLHSIVCIGDTESEREVCEKYGAKFYHYRNRVLGAKWQFGMDIARNLGSTDILYVGSSDWVSDTWCEELTPYLWAGYDLIGVNCGTMARVSAKGVMLGVYKGYLDGDRKGEPMGAGRLINNNILEKLDWEMFDHSRHDSMDWTMYTRIKQLGGRILVYDLSDMHHSPIARVSLECDAWHNMHSLPIAIKNGKAFEVKSGKSKWIKKWFPELNTFLKDIHPDISKDGLNILFVQHHPCVRNYKYAMHLKERGHNVYLLHEEALPMDYYNLGENPYVATLKEKVTGGNISYVISKYDIDTIHFHNRPDVPTTLLTRFNLPVVYDVHDPIQIDLVDHPLITFVFVNDDMLNETGKHFKKKITIPAFFLKESRNRPKKNGKMMYLGSFYWASVIPTIVSRLKEISKKEKRVIDIYCSTRQYWTDIEKEIGDNTNVRLKGVLSIDTFVNKDYEYGIYGILDNFAPVNFQMPSKVSDYIGFGLKPYNFGMTTKFSKALANGKYPKKYFRFETYYKQLLKAYRGD